MKDIRSLFKKSTGYGMALAALTIGGAHLSAELLVHEPFDYERRQWYHGADVPGEGIDGLNGGTGWDGAWNRISSDTLNAGIPVDEEDFGDDVGFRDEPLSYTDQAGNSIVTSGHQVRTSFGNSSWDRRLLDEPIGEPGSTVWLSFLAQAHDLSTAHPRWAFIELSEWGTYRVWMGNVTPVSTGNWAMQIPDRFEHLGGSVHGEAEDYPMNVPTLYLVKIEFPDDTWEGLTQFSVWLNPPDLTNEEALPDPVMELDTNYSEYSHIGVAGRYSTDFDEIRLGTTFDAVTPSDFTGTPELPHLTITSEEENIRISWEGDADGYKLYSSSDLEEWVEVTEEPEMVAGNHEVVLSPEFGRQFYRLQN